MVVRGKPNDCHDAEVQNMRVDQESCAVEASNAHEGQESYGAGAQRVRAGQESCEAEAWTEGLMWYAAEAKRETVSCVRLVAGVLRHAWSSAGVREGQTR